jgi:hypothetical protein
MLRRNLRIGSVLGHACSSVGVMVGLDLVMRRYVVGYDGVFPYPAAAAAVVSLLMLVLGARVVREDQRAGKRGPWQK